MEDTSSMLHMINKIDLILDVDGTLVHTTNRTPKSLDGLYPLKIEEEDDQIIRYTKIRPGMLKLLQSVKHMYNFHVCSMGTQNYVEAVVKLLERCQYSRLCSPIFLHLGFA